MRLVCNCRNTGHTADDTKYREAKKCVGQAMFLVKAKPIEVHLESLKSLGLPTETVRFAIVKPFKAQQAQRALEVSAQDKQGWLKKVVDKCIDARTCRTVQEFYKMLDTVLENSQVLKVPKKGGHAKLTHPNHPKRGTLQLIAVPLSTKSETWFDSKRGVVSCEPVVRIDNRKSVMKKVKGQTMDVQKALTVIDNTMMYFVTTYSRSNSGLFI